MKSLALLFSVFLIGALLTGCLREEIIEPARAIPESQPADVDANTPSDAQPFATEASAQTEQLPAPPPGQSWKLVWSDEFDGASINSSKWNITVSTKSRNPRPGIGVDDWWWRDDHAFLDGNGELTLRASKVDNNTMYCGSVDSRGLFETKYGYFEARIKVAETAKGNHTAFWFTGYNQGNVDGTANDGAEIDVFESAWVGEYTKSVIHIDGYGADHRANTKRWDAPNIHSGYHTYGLNWTPDKLEIYYDGVKRTEYTDVDWVPDVEEWLWLSVGASFGDGDFQSQPVGILSDAKVDYVRVWKSEQGGGFDPTVDAFRLVNKSTGKWIRTLGTDDDAEIIQASLTHTGDWTHWTIQRTTGDYFYFVNSASEKYFRPISEEAGSSLQLKPTSYGGSWTQWEMIDTGDGDGTVFVRNKETGRYIRPQSSANGDNIMLTSPSNTDDWQKWTLVPIN